MNDMVIRETDETKANEMAAVAKWAKYKKMEAKPLSRFEILDHALLNHNVIDHYVEYKKRGIASDKYPDVMLSFRKIKEALMLADCGPPTIFLIEWTDRFGWLTIVKPDTIGVGPCNRTETQGLFESCGYYMIEDHVTFLT